MKPKSHFCEDRTVRIRTKQGTTLEGQEAYVWVSQIGKNLFSQFLPTLLTKINRLR